VQSETTGIGKRHKTEKVHVLYREIACGKLFAVVKLRREQARNDEMRVHRCLRCAQVTESTFA
jgi:hypothetical protein